MKSFARMVGGRVAEIIPEFVDVDLGGGKSRAVPVSERYHPDFLAQLVPYDPSKLPDEPGLPTAPWPTTVTMRQARLALFNAGHLAAVNAAIAALEGDVGEAARIDWEYAAVVERASQTVVLLGQALQLDEAALDALFTEASTL